ncbi:MAG: response regulator [Gemmataceae bacterium]|nr:response regulator [Gemmataceae bacterium]
MADRPRILVLEGPDRTAGDLILERRPDWHVVRVDGTTANLPSSSERFDAIYFDTRNSAIWERVGQLFQSESILETLAEGVALVDQQLRITWANLMFEAWCDGPVSGLGFYEALGSPQILGPDYSPFHTALGEGKAVVTRLHTRQDRYLELMVTPVREAGGKVHHLICLCRDITAILQYQQKLAALHQAGQELAALAPEQLAEMSVEERVELLKLNIRRFTRDLLHYDVVEVRLLDRQTNRLEPLLEEGMTPAASQRVLHASPDGSGVTGFVAASGKSYVCADTATDPLYIEGAAGARSSMTVPLVYQDEVIGTFNVESPRVNAFGEEDLQFAEIFSREIAAALHTLELLTAEKRSTATRSVEAISREVALPVDDILAAAAAVLDQYIGHEPEMADKLRQILASARSIKQCIQKVGENLAPPSAAGAPAVTPHFTLKGMRVLVADSDERVRRSAHGILGGLGCVVETARDGKEALTMARLSTYDAILTDIRLPDVSGYEAWRKLRDSQPKARVILMTAFGYDPSHSIVKCRQEGLRSVLYKPFRVDQLLEALEKPESGATTAVEPARV